MIGVVVIGRNEGPRLARCLDAVDVPGVPVVYVDSGSTDDSVTTARAAGVDVIELDPARPFSAARGRNEGFARLAEGPSPPELVQFVDGDCTLDDDWLDAARTALGEAPDVVAVTGRLRERDAERSVFSRLCDLEWRRPVGDVPHAGGIFVVRADAFAAVGGFDESYVAGEEPELCARLRRAGGTIRSLPVDMGDHDAAMTRFGQWWQRRMRAGAAAARAARAQPRDPCVMQDASGCAAAWSGPLFRSAARCCWWVASGFRGSSSVRSWSRRCSGCSGRGSSACAGRSMHAVPIGACTRHSACLARSPKPGARWGRRSIASGVAPTG